MEPLAGAMIYDLSTKKETRITNSQSAVVPDIYSNRIVWEDNRNGNSDIYMYDLSTKKETQITSNISNSQSPAIYDNNIVWDDDRSGNNNIYAYDLITHQQIHTMSKSDKYAPAIYGNKVMWSNYQIQYKPEIYEGTISYLPVAAFTASPTSGVHPLNVQFTDKSTDAYYWYWKLGDGSTSTVQNPVHKYTQAGKYIVSLKVTNAAGSNAKTMSINVK
jgi:beta propeller repeat protein